MGCFVSMIVGLIFEKLAAFLCFTQANLFHLNPLIAKLMDKRMK